ncbi:MAG TPA: hypothetical protein PLV21_07440 [Cyclobacteriaceae bacterium]|nr:hypothetical protein [Cyclobacteriaceae bacterium]HRJ81698.1 hypothetical protein [Cyclobacteriaceae bacterium]
MKLEEFLSDLEKQHVPNQSRKAASIVTGTPLEIPEHQTKIELHNYLVNYGLQPNSPLFMTLWERHSKGLKLR